MRIAIGTHLSEAVLPQVYFNHIGVIARWAKQYDLVMTGTHRTKVAAARNRIIDAALAERCDHVLFIDSDHLLPDNMLDCLTENAAAAMVSGLVCKRLFPYDTVAFKLLPDGQLQQIVVNARGKVIEVDGCAMGCTLINLDLIKQLERPYFRDRFFRSDLGLCLAFRRKGMKVLLDTRVEIGHLSDPLIITPGNAERVRCNMLSVHLEKANGCSD